MVAEEAGKSWTRYCRRLCLIVALAVFCGLMIWIQFQVIRIAPGGDRIRPSTSYTYSNEGILYFTYSNGTVEGKPIPIRGPAADFLEDYHQHPSLENLSRDDFLNLTLPSTPEVNQSILWPQPVTAADQQFFRRLVAHLQSKLDYIHPSQKLIIYDIGKNSTYQMTDEQKNQILAFGRTEVRILSDVISPQLFSQVLREPRACSWKSVVVKLILSEFGAAMWMDTSVELTRSLVPELEQLVRPTGALDGSFLKSSTPPKMRFDVFHLKRLNGACFFYFLPITWHSIYCATPKHMKDHLAVDPKRLLRYEPQAGGFVVYNTEDCKKFIVEPVMACSLDYGCIGSRTETSEENRFGPVCHGTLEEQRPAFSRVDQSILSIVTTNYFWPGDLPVVQEAAVVERTP